MHHGLFQVTERIYQIRGFDISNMTMIEGERGLIVIDPLISTETARAGLDLYRQHRGPAAGHGGHLHPQPRRPLRRRARGGRRGGRPGRARARSSRPLGFMEEVVAENVLAGTAMVRRAQFQFGAHAAQGAARPGRCRARQGHLARDGHADPAHARDQPSRSRRHRMDGHRDRVPARARDRGAGRDAHVLSRAAGAEPGRERHPQPAQHLSDPRRPGARRQRVGQVPERGARSVRAGRRRRLRPASLAGVGERARARLSGQAARPLQVPARPDRATHEPRLQGGRDRRAPGAAAEPGSAPGTCAATTARSATTPSRSISAISAGTTPTRPTSTRCRRSSAGASMSSTWAVPPPCWRGRARISPGASTASSPRR